MKRVGIIGGIGPASTIEYYKLIISLFRERLSTNHYPELVVHSIDMTRMLNFVFENELEELVHFLQERIQVLQEAKVEVVALASNTPHLVFDELAKRVEVEMISIVEESCKKIAQSGLEKVGLLGTKSTMSKGFYQLVGERYGLTIVSPSEESQTFVHEKYMGELVFNKIYPETKKQLIQIIHDMQKKTQIEGVILGGTELPLILDQDDFEEIKVFNTTMIHVNAILDKMLS